MTNVSQIRAKQKKANATVAIATVSPSEGVAKRRCVLAQRRCWRAPAGFGFFMDNNMVSETSNPVAYTSEIKRLSIQGIIYTFIHNYELVGKNLMKFIHHTSNIQSIQLQSTKVMRIRANLVGEIG